MGNEKTRPAVALTALVNIQKLPLYIIEKVLFLNILLGKVLLLQHLEIFYNMLIYLRKTYFFTKLVIVLDSFRDYISDRIKLNIRHKKTLLHNALSLQANSISLNSLC